MNDTLASLLLGIIEGITEFLPISSTGHLLIAEHWLGARSDLFNIAIQAGAILAVVLIYRARLLELVLGLGNARNRDYALKLALAFGVTGVLGLLVKKLGVELPETLAPIAWALLIGGFAILAIEAIDARRPDLPDDDPNAIGWGTAVLVGLAQVLAGVFPGTSRSAAAIFAALLFGRSSRVAATEFAFLVGIPTMFAATGYELLDVVKEGGAAGEDWTGLAIAFVASAITAFIAVKWLLGYIQTHRFTVFAWYRIVLGAALLVWGLLGATPAAAATRTAEKVHASDAFELAYRCNALARLEASAAKDAVRLAELRQSATSPGRESPVTDLEREQIAEYEFNRVFVAQSRPLCSGRVQADDHAVLMAALRAADLGDDRAAECYLSKGFQLPAPDVVRAERVPPEVLAEHADYVVKARRLIASGLARGDWRMAAQSLWNANPRAYNGIDDRSDPTVAYRMARLLEHGRARARDREAMASNGAFYAGSLTAAQLAVADAWVKQKLPLFMRSPVIVGDQVCPLLGRTR